MFKKPVLLLLCIMAVISSTTAQKIYELNDGWKCIKASSVKDDGKVAFFNRVSLVNSKTKERILPTFYSDNYVSVLPGESKTIIVNCNKNMADAAIEIEGWNTGKQVYSITNK